MKDIVRQHKCEQVQRCNNVKNKKSKKTAFVKRTQMNQENIFGNFASPLSGSKNLNPESEFSIFMSAQNDALLHSHPP